MSPRPFCSTSARFHDGGAGVLDVLDSDNDAGVLDVLNGDIGDE